MVNLSTNECEDKLFDCLFCPLAVLNKMLWNCLFMEMILIELVVWIYKEMIHTEHYTKCYNHIKRISTGVESQYHSRPQPAILEPWNASILNTNMWMKHKIIGYFCIRHSTKPH